MADQEITVTTFAPESVSLDLQSPGPLLFSPEVAPDGTSVLFVADVAVATVYAVELPPEGAAPAAEVRVDRLGTKVGALLGVDREDVVIRGLAVHPGSHAVYLSIARGHGSQAAPALVRADPSGELPVVSLDGLPTSSFVLDDAPTPDDERLDTWVDGTDENSTPMEFHGVALSVARVPSRLQR